MACYTPLNAVDEFKSQAFFEYVNILIARNKK